MRKAVRRAQLAALALLALALLFVGVTAYFGWIDWNKLTEDASGDVEAAIDGIDVRGPDWAELRERARIEDISLQELIDLDRLDALGDLRLPELERPDIEVAIPRLPRAQAGGETIFFCGEPIGGDGNRVIVREIYAISNNPETKFADWAAYRITRETISGGGETGRDWAPDPDLDERHTLEPGDYRGAHAALGTDRGHQVPLASFAGTPHWEQTNFLSNITPQRSELNQGPWRLLEEAERNLVRETGLPVFVVTGPLYEEEMPGMPGADEEHQVPSGYWKVVCVEEEPGEPFDDVECAAFIMSQDTPRSAEYLDFVVSIDEVERRSGFDLLPALPDAEEAELEERENRRWARRALN